MFNLPRNTEIGRIIPKNAFESYCNSKQKKSFVENLKRIVWQNKLSLDTINLTGDEVQEIQIFTIELKKKIEIKDLLTVIDKAIPYHIIFKILFEEEYYLSASVKHSNPQNENMAVIDYTFSSNWKSASDPQFTLELRNNLDWVYRNFCLQFTNEKDSSKQITELVKNLKDEDALQKEITKLKAAISRSKQFNKKVELNLKLRELILRARDC